MQGIVPDSQIGHPSCSNGLKILGSRHTSIHESTQDNPEPSISRNRSRILDNLLSSLFNEENYVNNVVRLVGLEDAYKNHQDTDVLNDDGIDYKIVNLPHFVGSTERKLKMRSTMIKKLIECKTDENAYQEHFEYFMEMEESIFENGC